MSFAPLSHAAQEDTNSIFWDYIPSFLGGWTTQPTPTNSRGSKLQK